MKENKGVIYILTNPSFPDYVKLGYADDVEKRLQELNRSECIPFAFRIYATYKVPKRLTDLSLHRLIDKLNPNLRAIDTFNGKPRKKEFYAMSPEDAYALLEAIAEIHDCSDKLKLYPVSDKEKEAETVAELISIESDRKPSKEITLNEYLMDKNETLVNIYKIMHSEILDKLNGAEIKAIPMYIGWRVNGKYFAEITIQKNAIRILTLEPKNDYGIGEKIPDSYQWTLNYKTSLNSIENIECIKNIIEDSYKQRAKNI